MTTDPSPAGPAAQPGLWALMRPVNGTIIAAIILSCISATLMLTAAAAFALVLAAMAAAGSIPFSFAAGWSVTDLVMAVVGLTLGSLVTRTLAFVVSHLGAFRLEEILRTRLTAHLARLPLGEVMTLGTGAVKKMVHDDVKQLHAFVADSTPFLGRAILSPLLSAVLLVVLDWRLALVAFGVLVLGLVALRFAMADYGALRRQYDGAREHINRVVIEFVQAMPVVRTFDGGSTSFRRYTEALDQFHGVLSRWLEATGRAARLGMLVLSPLPTLVVVTIVGVLLVADGALSPAVLVAVLLLATGTAEALMPLMWLSDFIRKARASAYRLHDLMARPPLPESPAPRAPGDASVRFEAVRFTYPGRPGPALDGIDFTVAPGTVTALVGSSGAGKSTVARLIPRFWDVDAGRVVVGGVDVREIAPDVLMRQVSFVFQDTFLFHATIADNIRMARPEASDAEVRAAAIAAQADEFIQALPLGYDTIVGDRGALLSGGQRQRVTIARAVLRDAPILVLDEATAFADPENEAAIVKALAVLMQGRTVIIIAHRLSTIADADQIVVLGDGHVRECGRHADLLRQDGPYAALWSAHAAAQDWSLGHAQPVGAP